jgi:hypothetical protein
VDVRGPLLALVLCPAVALAQPVDPYAPSKQPATPPSTPVPIAPLPPATTPTTPPTTPTPTPSSTPTPSPDDGNPGRLSDDPVLAEQVAQQLVARAQELYDARVFPDAKQLAVEALVRSPKGAAAEHAHFLIHAVNQQLGISEETEKPKVDLAPIEDPTLKHDKVPADQPLDDAAQNRRIAASVHGGIYAGLVGTMIGSFFSSDNPAAGAVAMGAAGGLAGGVGLPKLTERLGMSEAQIRTTGSASVWGGVIGGLFGDAVTRRHTDGREVLVGASIGATVGLAGGYLGSRENQLTRGDVALVDTFAGIGTIGGLTVGMLMQPAQKDAYAVNSIVGTSVGVVAGLIAAPQTNTTQRRMLRVAGLSLAGGAVPFLLYAAIHSSTSTADERVTGALSTVGLIGGAWLGFYLTDGMDDGLDTLDGKKHEPVEDAPASVVGRSSDGHWGLAGLGIQPLSPVLAPQPGMSVSLLGARF